MARTQIRYTDLTPTGPYWDNTGALSAAGIVYSAGGNSNQWNNVYTTVATSSATWGTSSGTDSYTVQIELPDNKEYIFDARAIYNYTLSAVHFYAVSGTGNLSLRINNSTIPEFDQCTISNTLSTIYLTTNNVVSSNQTFTAMVSNNSFMSDLIVDVIYTR